MGNRNRIEKMVFIALLVAFSVVLSFIDRQLSFALEHYGARIGLANIVVLTGIYYLNRKDALLLVFLKALISGLLLANFNAFLIGLSGSFLSYLIMSLLLYLGKERFSFIGISVAGSIFHNLGQILVLLFLYSWGIISSLIWLLPIGIATGVFVGTLFLSLKHYLDKGYVFKTITVKATDHFSHLFNQDQEAVK